MGASSRKLFKTLSSELVNSARGGYDAKICGGICGGLCVSDGAAGVKGVTGTGGKAAEAVVTSHLDGVSHLNFAVPLIVRVVDWVGIEGILNCEINLSVEFRISWLTTSVTA